MQQVAVQPSPMSPLPEDTILHTCRYLNPHALSQFSQCCHKTQTWTNTESLWRDLFDKKNAQLPSYLQYDPAIKDQDQDLYQAPKLSMKARYKKHIHSELRYQALMRNRSLQAPIQHQRFKLSIYSSAAIGIAGLIYNPGIILSYLKWSVITAGASGAVFALWFLAESIHPHHLAAASARKLLQCLARLTCIAPIYSVCNLIGDLGPYFIMFGTMHTVKSFILNSIFELRQYLTQEPPRPVEDWSS